VLTEQDLRASEVSSATDINVKKGGEEAGKGEAKTRRPNPVALEVPVSVAGARPATAQEKRELFSEDTSTVLVFKDGAVIQLSAAIAVGQLLFLTDKRTKREVVCQVVHKRSHRPTSCYVELEFTEEVDNFWGVSFPDKEESDEIPRTAEAVEAEETTEDDRSEPVAAPKTEDVAQLKDEVETLRAQLRELQEKQAAEEKKALEEREEQARRLAEAEAAARAAAEAEARAKAERVAEEARQKALMADEETKRAAEEARKWEEESIEKERERKRAEKERKEREEAEREKAEKEKEEGSRVPKIGMRLPSGAPSAPVETPAAAKPAGGKEEVDPLEDLLPKPALDFSHAPKGLDPNDPYNIYKPLRKRAGLAEIVAAVVVVLLLIGGGGFAWYQNWLPFLHHRVPELPTLPKNAPVAKPGPVTNAAKAQVTANAQPAGNATTGTAANAGGTAAATAESKPGTGSDAKTAEPPAEKPAEEVVAEEKPAEKKPENKKAAAAKASSKKDGKNHGKAETSAESKPKLAVTDEASDAPVEPAKLLHAVSPVYPPDAMRGYITGDVRIEAEVDAAGRVGAMKILVGPEALRQAAKDALKQYEYAPATQGGKAVASKVVVTVKFWFDP
jgi:TonB family protein